MPNYQKGKIYKITSGDLIYIGSTTQETLAQRLSGHVSKYKSFQNGKAERNTSFQLIETGNYEITLIELCPCGSKDELHSRERFHIENTMCVNKFIPTRTAQEWRLFNQEKIIEDKKEYYKANSEILKEQMKSYYQTHREEIIEKVKARRQAKKDLKNKI